MPWWRRERESSQGETERCGWDGGMDGGSRIVSSASSLGEAETVVG